MVVRCGVGGRKGREAVPTDAAPRGCADAFTVSARVRAQSAQRDDAARADSLGRAACVRGARRSGNTSDMCSGLHDDHASHQYVRRGTDGSVCGTASPLTTLSSECRAYATPRHVRAAGYLEAEAGGPLVWVAVSSAMRTCERLRR